jgi:hypothetical protein
MNESIVNIGNTTTTINNKKINEINWDARYDGQIANINLDINNNGQEEHVTMKLTNNDLVRLLNGPTSNQSLEQSLMKDFNLQSKMNNTKKRKVSKQNKKTKGKSKSKVNKKTSRKNL